ncbi:type II secretion system protein GspM [Aliidiomarina haloalkalitolerans]|uniref:MSHA biogenesis protein MshJ n=1 Tax=Aliidiomarina haloalkalitolerans TaxID=859059 RepID=A0A432VPL4_9GAMM|nr:type II secretion system protein GspM [Aliidiomarina haloalkalitolerans]RUO18080.1 hypothetical protein CWE06_11945 [Aliidiomarina haloalkalitolerans]
MARIYFKQITKKGQNWFGEKPTREQWIIAILAIGGIAWLMYILLIEPMSVKYAENERRLAQINTTSAQYDREIAQLRERLNVNPNRELEQQERQLTMQAERLQREIDGVVQFNDPEVLVEWMQRMLEGAGGRRGSGLVALTSFTVHPPQPFLENRVDARVYRHNVEVTVEGRYFQIRDYLNTLQELPYGAYWEGIQYDVDQYPNGRVTLRMYTLTQERMRR